MGDPNRAKRATPEGGFAAVVALTAKISNTQPAKRLREEMQPAMNMLARSLRALGRSKYEMTRQKFELMKGEPRAQHVCTCTVN